MISKLLKGAVIASVFAAGSYGSSGGCAILIESGKNAKHGAYWIEKHTCKKSYSNVFSAKKTISYGVEYDMLTTATNGKTDFADTKIRIKVTNHCYFLEKGKNGWKRDEWRKIDNDTVEIRMGESSVKGADLSIDNVDKKQAWNVFNSPLNCSEEPQREKWTVYQKIDGGWQVTAQQTFIINP